MKRAMVAVGLAAVCRFALADIALVAPPVELNRDWLMRPFDEASVTPAGDPKAETFLGWYAAMAQAYPDAKTLADMAVAYAHDAGVTDAEIAAFRELMLEKPLEK